MTADHDSTEAATTGPEPLSAPITQGEGEEGAKRQCTGVSKKTGERCKAFAMRGSDMCAGHAGVGFGADPSAAARKSADTRSGQAEVRKQRVRDRLAAAVEGDLADAIIAAYRKGLESDDPATAMRAAEGILSRVYGKPKETVEQVQKPAEVQRLEDLSDEEFFAEWARFQAEQA